MGTFGSCFLSYAMSECSPYFKGNYLSIQLKRLTGYMMREISMLPGQRLSLETQGIRK